MSVDQNLVESKLGSLEIVWEWSVESSAGLCLLLTVVSVMPKNCSIPECTSRSDKEKCKDLSFHKLPTEVTKDTSG